MSATALLRRAHNIADSCLRLFRDGAFNGAAASVFTPRTTKPAMSMTLFHLLLLFRRQDVIGLLVRAFEDRSELCLLLLAGQRRIVSDSSHLISGVLVNALQLRSLVGVQSQIHAVTALPSETAGKAMPAAMVFTCGLHLLLLLRRQHRLELLASALAQRSNFGSFFFG